MSRLFLIGWKTNHNMLFQGQSIDNEQLANLLHELSEQQKQTHRDFEQLKEENQGGIYEWTTQSMLKTLSNTIR